MKVVLQRVTSASVKVEGEIISEIAQGIVILVGFVEDDSETDIEWLVNKIINLRIFNDENGVMNNSLVAVNGDVIVVSQFTLQASTKKGNRPAYIKAAKPTTAIPLYEKFIKAIEIQLDKKVGTGKFGADMKVSLVNDGPVTIIIDSKNKD